MTAMTLQPFDEHNQKLASNVRPDDWSNPTPSGRYNLVVIGAGTAGLVTAAGAAGLGAKVALIERDLMGGDCLNVGCVPSKALLSAARTVATVRDAGRFGVEVPGDVQVEFQSVMERMRRLRAEISPHDSAARFRDLGIDVFLGQGTFTSEDSIEVNGQSLQFKHAVVATGARASMPPIPGVDDVDVLTNETVFSLTELPSRMAIIGGGPIGCEMAQAFARFGTKVTLIEKSAHILPREETDAAMVVQSSMERDQVQFLFNAKVVRFEKRGNETVTFVEQDGETQEVVTDRVLLGIGRTPNIDGMGLEVAGVEYDSGSGVQVDDRLRTTNPKIFAAGDVASRFRFTHAADFMARIVIQNALFLGRKKVSSLVIPWATYTSPEIAHVGLTPKQASEQGIQIDTFTQQFTGVDRAVLEGQSEGFARVHLKRGTDRIFGATIVSEHAGEMISEVSLAMTNGLGLKKIGATIHPYPTQTEAVRKLADQYNRTRLTPFVASLMKKWLEWTR
ncbi:Mercuric reductase [Thalassoglobus neptunius]|uniref:Mercuric reductase n=1 Tax=Thalassoglobus neptunius TaxID=1938619 RepID=A0A5C5WC41_9PLAN|nr:mercuric reductase [Thalassoglobus neptunius]TWT48230.1 Mercuric reductase [Thalassoglobus neptunius]